MIRKAVWIECDICEAQLGIDLARTATEVKRMAQTWGWRLDVKGHTCPECLQDEARAALDAKTGEG